MKRYCEHQVLLPRGLTCAKGYLSIRLMIRDRLYTEGVGAHTPETFKLATMRLAKLQEDQLLGRFDIESKKARITVAQAIELYWQKHFVEYRDPETHAPRSKDSITTAKSHLWAFKRFAGRLWLDTLLPKDIRSYRAYRLEFDHSKAGTVNKDMAYVNSMLNMFKQWNIEKEIEPVQLPAENPCQFVPDMKEIPRDRVASIDELRKLKQSCKDLNDMAMWSIIETELYTSLRLNDLQKLEHAEVENGIIALTQGKTGTGIKLPGEVKPNWSKVFTNFRSRWERTRSHAGIHDLQFRDLRKTSLRLVEDQFTSEQLANKAGHSSDKITKAWYLKGLQAEKMRPVIEATKRIVENL